jgi:hypothetical protein
LYAIDATNGTVKWIFDAGAPLAGGVTVTGTTALFGTFDNRVLAVDIGDQGSLSWSRPVNDWAWGTPQVYSDTVYVGTLSGTLYALQLNTGEVLWEHTIASKPACAPPCCHPGQRLRRGARRPAAPSSAPPAVRAGTSPWPFPTGSCLQPQIWRDQIVVVLMGDGLPLLHLRSAADGAEVWAFKP